MRRLKIFVSSPGDVIAERQATRHVIGALNEEMMGNVFLVPVLWEQEPLLASETFQAQIESPEHADIVIGVLWSRIGSPLPKHMVRADGTRYASGTAFELESALAAHKARGKPDILLYRKLGAPTVSLDDRQELMERLEQMDRLDGYIKDNLMTEDGSYLAAFHTFDTEEQFADLLKTHLRKLILKQLDHTEPTPDGHQSETDNTAERASVSADAPSIAVLPFANMSADPEQEYFCDGITEEIINALTKLKQLRVVARTSAFQFKNQALDLREVGAKLGVTTVLEGSVRKAGNRLRVTAQLISVSDGYHLWSERFDRAMDDVFEMQDDITQAVVEKLKVKLFAQGDAPIVARPTENLDAYNLYLKGRYHSRRRTPDAFRKATECFESVIKMDPRFALAYVGLAECYVLSAWHGAVPTRDAVRKATPLARQALEIDPALGQAHYTLGFIKGSFESEWTAAQNEFTEAIRLYPDDAVGCFWHGLFYLGPMGQLNDAVAELQRGLDLEPLSPFMNMVVGVCWMFCRDYEKAVSSFQAALELDPSFPLAHGYLGETYCLQHKYHDAEIVLRKAQPSPVGCHWSIGMLGYCFGRGGKTDDARRVLRELHKLSETTYIPALSVAMVHVGLDEVDHAFTWLTRACDEKYGALAWLSIDPIFDTLRDNSRFDELLQRMKLPRLEQIG